MQQKKSTLTSGGLVLLSTIWGAYGNFTQAVDLPANASGFMTMLADPPIYLPWLILAGSVITLTWSLWPSGKDEISELSANSQSTSGPQSHSIGLVQGDANIGNTIHHNYVAGVRKDIGLFIKFRSQARYLGNYDGHIQIFTPLVQTNDDGSSHVIGINYLEGNCDSNDIPWPNTDNVALVALGIVKNYGPDVLSNIWLIFTAKLIENRPIGVGLAMNGDHVSEGQFQVRLGVLEPGQEETFFFNNDSNYFISIGDFSARAVKVPDREYSDITLSHNAQGGRVMLWPFRSLQ